MRPIKFRAWDKNDRDSFRMKNNLSLNSAYFSKESLDGIVVMQFTGLLDKNGKEIYEGDVVKFNGSDYHVHWNEDFGMWDGVSREEAKVSEVIGNIMENPELLKS